jgi:hypothetical protein
MMQKMEKGIQSNDPPHMQLQEAYMHGNISVRLVSGLNCPWCAKPIRNVPEHTSDGWSIYCTGCHKPMLIVEAA